MTIAFDLKRFEESRVLVVGEVMLDRCLRGDVNRISPETRLPVFRVEKESELPGGGGNVTNLAGLVSGDCRFPGITKSMLDYVRDPFHEMANTIRASQAGRHYG